MGKHKRDAEQKSIDLTEFVNRLCESSGEPDGLMYDCPGLPPEGLTRETLIKVAEMLRLANEAFRRYMKNKSDGVLPESGNL